MPHGIQSTDRGTGREDRVDCYYDRIFAVPRDVWSHGIIHTSLEWVKRAKRLAENHCSSLEWLAAAAVIEDKGMTQALAPRSLLVVRKLDIMVATSRRAEKVVYCHGIASLCT